MTENTPTSVDYARVSLPQKPRLAPWITSVDLGDNRMQLRGAEFSFTLQHPLFIETFQSIHSLLDGKRTVEEILASRDPKYLPTTITFLLKILRANGVLQEGIVDLPEPLPPETLQERENQVQFFSHFVLDPVSTLTQLHKARIGLIGADSIVKKIRKGLLDMGFSSPSEFAYVDKGKTLQPSHFKDEIARQLNGVEFLIACQDSAHFRFFEAINTACLETQTRWTHVAISGTKGIMGPTFIPRQSACYTCYDKRLASNAPDLQDYLSYQKQVDSPLSEGYLSPLWTTLSEQVVLEMTRIISGFAPPKTIGRLYEFETTTPLVKSHDVFRLPRCFSCNLKKPRREAWDLVSLKK